MAQEEIVKLIKVDTGDSQQTVKGLRDEIKSLRDNLLNLKEGTDDYGKAVDKLQDDQKRLDKVMSLTKKTATALEGSYDALVQEMALLKKTWRATNDEAKRNELGKQIATINDKLKAMDEEVGNFSRNVGNYTNSIVDAFEQMNHSVDEFKNAAADAWEKGDIEAYTKAIKEAGKAQAKVEKIEQDLEASTPTLEKGLQNLTDTAAGLAGGFEVFQSIMVLTGNESEDFEKVMIKVQATMALVQGLQGIGGLIKGLKGLKTAIKSVSVAMKAMSTSSWVGLILTAVAALGSFIYAMSRANKEVEDYSEEVSALAEVQERLNRSFERGNEELEREIMLMEAEGKSPKEILEKRIATAKDQKTQQEGLARYYAGEIESKHHKVNYNSENRVVTTEANYSLWNQPTNKQMPQKQAEIDEKKGLLQDALNSYWDLDKKIKDFETQIKALGIKEKKAEELAAADAIKQRDIYVQAVVDEASDMEIGEEPFGTDSKIDLSSDNRTLKGALLSRKSFIDLEGNRKLVEERNKLLEQGIKDEKQFAEIEYQNTLEKEQKKYDAIREYWEKATGPEKLELYEQMKEQELAIDEMTYERKKEMRDEDLAHEAEVMSQKQELFQNSMSLLSTVVKGMGDLYQQDLDNQLAAGKISAEAYEEQFKKVKAMQIAEATINTIAGALGAFMGITKSTGGWGIAAAALQAAAVLATGTFEIAKIAKTEPGAANVERGMVQAPQNIFNEEQPKETHILTGNKETEELNKATKVYILESELEESRKKVQIVDEETSF